MSNPTARYRWILSYLKGLSSYDHVDVLNQAFSDAYIEAFNPSFVAVYFGANKCRQLGLDLSAMYKAGLLARSCVGLGVSNQLEDAWPKWIYCYSLPNIGAVYAID